MNQISAVTSAPDSLSLGIELVERGLVPDWITRCGIRRICRERINQLAAGDPCHRWQLQDKFLSEIRRSPIAIATDKANDQHYEVPAEFFELVMGTHKKYSCCYFEAGVDDLSVAERRMLDLTIERAEIQNGMQVLELGCGWGSLSLRMAERFPQSTIVGVSNSSVQREYIQKQIAKRNLTNLEIRTADMNTFTFEGQVDRIVSVEMFEHMRNYEKLLAKVASWLKPEGKLFVHIFVHKEYAYPYDTEGSSNWLGKYFFTGGCMPSDQLLYHFQKDLLVTNQWRISGVHYQKTAEKWYQNHLRNKREILKIFRVTYGPTEAERWFNRWKVFFLSCAELWGFRGGTEWWVSHYLFSKRSA